MDGAGAIYDHINHGKTPLAGFIFSIVLAMLAISTLSFCIARRTKMISSGSKPLPLARWLILGVYVDSWIFVFSATVLQASLGLDSSHGACDAAILLCLTCYLSSKVLLYFFLVEKVWIIRGRRKSRMKDKLYLFNSIGMLLPYIIVISLTFAYRRADLESGQCRIGLYIAGNVPLLVFDVCINVYLTALFLQPLKQMYAFNTNKGKLRTMARRTFIGSACTLLSTIANLTALLVLDGKEPGWVCFASCNGDVLFSALVLHWVTHVDPDDDVTICNACQGNMNKHANTLVSARHTHTFARTNFGGEVVTDITAVKATTKAAQEQVDAIPLGKIACTVETTQDMRDLESLETEDAFNECSKTGSTDHINTPDRTYMSRGPITE